MDYSFSLSTLLLLMVLVGLTLSQWMVSPWLGGSFAAASLLALIRTRKIGIKHAQVTGQPMKRRDTLMAFICSIGLVYGVACIAAGVGLSCVGSSAMCMIPLDVFPPDLLGVAAGAVAAIFSAAIAGKALGPISRYIAAWESQRQTGVASGPEPGSADETTTG